VRSAGQCVKCGDGAIRIGGEFLQGWQKPVEKSGAGAMTSCRFSRGVGNAAARRNAKGHPVVRGDSRARVHSPVRIPDPVILRIRRRSVRRRLAGAAPKGSGCRQGIIREEFESLDTRGSENSGNHVRTYAKLCSPCSALWEWNEGTAWNSLPRLDH